MIIIKKKNKIFLLLLLLLTLSLSVVKADDINQGSITVKLKDKNKSIEGVEIYLSKVADIIEGEYVLYPEYNGVDINNIENAESLKKSSEKLKVLAKKSGKIRKLKTDDKGEAVFDNLNDGAYLIMAEECSDLKEISPVIINMPYYNETEDFFEYNIICEPKVVRENLNPPKTGDDTDIMVYICGLFLGILLIVVISVFMKKIKALTINNCMIE